jgi:hypothetical protein
MTAGAVVDIVAVRDCRRRLTALAAAHPELCCTPSPENVTGWIETLTKEEHVGSQQIGTRVPDELVARIDAYLERMNAENPGLEVTRADAIRVLLTKALDAEAPAKRKRVTTSPTTQTPDGITWQDSLSEPGQTLGTLSRAGVVGVWSSRDGRWRVERGGAEIASGRALTRDEGARALVAAVDGAVGKSAKGRKP